MKIAIGSDHAGFEYKGKLLALLAYLGHEAMDYGAYSEESTDYPEWIRPVAEAVARGEVDRGIVLGGSGNGEAIVANRVPGVRCTLCWNAESARNTVGSTTTPTCCPWDSGWYPGRPPARSWTCG